MTDKERLEEIKEQYDWTVTTSLQPILEDDDIIWLIQQAEQVDVFADKFAKLNQYLQKFADDKGWGKHVIDIAIQIMDEQDERIEELEMKCDFLVGLSNEHVDLAHKNLARYEFEKAEKSLIERENERYKEALGVIQDIINDLEIDEFNTINHIYSLCDEMLKEE